MVKLTTDWKCKYIISFGPKYFLKIWWDKLLTMWFETFIFCSKVSSKCWKRRFRDPKSKKFAGDMPPDLTRNVHVSKLDPPLDVTTTMNLVVVSSQVLHVLTYCTCTRTTHYRFAKLYNICWNVIEQYCYFTNPVNSVQLQGLQPYPVIISLWYFYKRQWLRLRAHKYKKSMFYNQP